VTPRSFLDQGQRFEDEDDDEHEDDQYSPP
jgi:hypothetical protein